MPAAAAKPRRPLVELGPLAAAVPLVGGSSTSPPAAGWRPRARRRAGRQPGDPASRCPRPDRRGRRRRRPERQPHFSLGDVPIAGRLIGLRRARGAADPDARAGGDVRLSARTGGARVRSTGSTHRPRRSSPRDSCSARPRPQVLMLLAIRCCSPAGCRCCSPASSACSWRWRCSAGTGGSGTRINLGGIQPIEIIKAFVLFLAGTWAAGCALAAQAAVFAALAATSC
jgi:hypothetical protein